MGKDYKRHPSYANLQIGRSFCSGRQTLFGSSIKHSDIISLKINPAYIGRNSNDDYVFSESLPYIEVNMSQAQFAQAITSLNMGAGIPVTLKYFNGQNIEQCPFEDKRMQFDNEFARNMNNVVENLKAVSREAEDLLKSKKTLSKGDRDKILAGFEDVQKELSSTMPFIYAQFNRQMEKTVTEAKAEVEGHIQSRLQDMAALGMKIEGSAEHMPVIEEAGYAEDTDEEFEETEEEGMQMGGM